MPNDSLQFVTLNNGTMTGPAYYSWGTFLAGGGPKITAIGGNNTISSGNFGLDGTNPVTFNTPALTDALKISAVLGATYGIIGAVTKSGNGLVTLSANNIYTGGTTVNAGILKLAAASTNNIASSRIVTVNSGATLDVTGLSGGAITLASGQTLAGTGVVEGGVVSANGSYVAPSTGGGELVVWGNYQQNSGAVFKAQISSTSSYGTMVVTHTATLAGSLNVTLGNGYQLMSGDAFTVLSARSLAGSFNSSTEWSRLFPA